MHVSLHTTSANTRLGQYPKSLPSMALISHALDTCAHDACGHLQLSPHTLQHLSTTSALYIFCGLNCRLHFFFPDCKLQVGIAICFSPPLQIADASGCVSVFSTNTIRLARRDNTKADEEFVFDQVFDEATSQEEIFNCECWFLGLMRA